MISSTIIAVLLSVSVVAAAETPAHEFAKMRDPFKQPEIARLTQEPKTPLELHPVDQIRMVGIITGPKKMRAMLVTPDGQSHLVTEKAKIGTRRGVVARVNFDSVLVREKIVNVIGEEEDLDTVIRLAPEKPEGKQ